MLKQEQMLSCLIDGGRRNAGLL